MDESKHYAELGFSRMFCALHGEPFRAEWPKGAIIFQLTGLREVLDENAEELASLMLPTDEPDAAGPRSVERLLDRKPMCCRLKRERLVELYTGAAIGRKARCVACHKKQLGTSLLTRPDPRSSETVVIPHVCFRCLAFRAVDQRPS